MHLYKQYLEEREGGFLIAEEHGFVTYKQIDALSVWIVDIFVEKDHRKEGIATRLSALVVEEARKLGCTRVYGTADINAKGVTTSLKSILADGFEFSHAEGNMLYFIKNIQ